MLGPIFFQATPYVYIGWGVMLVLTYFIFRTRWGLRLRSSGEYPQAAATVGIDVIRVRYRAMLLAGAIAGFAGSYLSLHSAGSFQMNMSAGKGWIAIAAMIFGAWNPIGAFGAALVFGFADASQQLLSSLGVDVPPQFLASVPYILHHRGGRRLRRPRSRTGHGGPALRAGLTAGERRLQRRRVGTRPRGPHLPQGEGGSTDGAVRHRRPPDPADHRQRPGP